MNTEKGDEDENDSFEIIEPEKHNHAQGIRNWGAWTAGA
jgi:hypothetical protein